MSKATPPVTAILCADLHLCEKPPVARSVESDWWAVQAKYLGQLHDLANAHGDHDPVTGLDSLCPVVVAGDVFDKHSPNPATINFAIRHMPNCHGVPGQHDLGHHNLEDIRRSAFWTLVEAGKVTYLAPGRPVEVGTVRLHGFPWGAEIKPLERPHGMLTEVAVIHRYAWTATSGAFPGAPKDGRVKSLAKVLRNYTVAACGDNHVPFDWNADRAKNDWPAIFNAGSFFRRKIDEKSHRPSVGLLHSDGTVTRHYLDCSEDKFIDADDGETAREGPDFTEFLRELDALADAGIDFAEAVRRGLDSLHSDNEGAVRVMVTKAMGG